MEGQTKCPVCDNYVCFLNGLKLACKHKYHIECIIHMDQLCGYEDSKSLHFSSKDCLLCRPDWETYKKTFVSLKEKSMFNWYNVGPAAHIFTCIMSHGQDFGERLKPRTILIILFIYTLIMLFTFLF